MSSGFTLLQIQLQDIEMYEAEIDKLELKAFGLVRRVLVYILLLYYLSEIYNSLFLLVFEHAALQLE